MSIDYEKLLEQRLRNMEDKISDLQWRMNAVCNELSLRDKSVTEKPCDNVEKIKQAKCCGKIWSYTATNWSTAMCHLCGKNLNECDHVDDEYQHEYPFGIDFNSQSAKCIKCGEFYR